MNPSTGTFISMDSYQGSIYDPVSLHKYLYANANPVMYTDPSGYESKTLNESMTCLAISAILSSAVLFSGQVALNIFSNLRKNMSDAVLADVIYGTQRDWQTVILTFPSRNFDTSWIITVPAALLSSRLYLALYEIEEVDEDVNTPGVPDENDEDSSDEDDTVTSNEGSEYDNKPSENHSKTTKNPVKNQEPNSSVDIVDKNGNVIRRRWFDSEGKAERDLDYTDHGNPKQHPEVPHEHIWDWSKSKPRQ